MAPPAVVISTWTGPYSVIAVDPVQTSRCAAAVLFGSLVAPDLDGPELEPVELEPDDEEPAAAVVPDEMTTCEPADAAPCVDVW